MTEQTVIITPKFKRVSREVQLIADAIEHGYLDNHADVKFKQKNSFSPSSIGYGHGTCPRYWYYALNGADFSDKASARGFANMAYGTSSHERLQNILKQSGIVDTIEEEIIFDDPPIRGFVDVVFNFDGELVPGEIKTARQESWDVRLSSGKPIDYHLVQILIYMHIKNAQKGVFLYENKNTQEILLLDVEMTEKNKQLVMRIFEWLRNVYENYKSGTLPMRPFTQKSKQCKYCPLFDACWNDADGENKMEKLDIT